jgi:hypothetical protein
VRRQQWDDPTGAGWAEATAVDGDTLLTAARAFGFEDLEHGWSWTMMLNIDQARTLLTRATAAGSSTVWVSYLEASCAIQGGGREQIVCAAFDGRRTRILAAAPTDQSLTAIGSLNRQFLSDSSTRGDWMTGWLDCRAAAIDVTSRRAIVASPGCSADSITVSGGVAAVLVHEGQSTRVRIYRLPGSRL